MSKGEIQGVILAAGKGSRMAPFSSRYPKPLLPVCNKPILVHQIETMASLGIRDIIVVIGHLGYEITRVLGTGSQYGVQIRYVEQKEILGIAHAVSQLEKFVNRPFLLFLGDIFFDTKNLDTMMLDLTGKGAAAVLAVKHEDNPEAIKRNFAVQLDGDGFVRRVIEKPRYIRDRLKGCGLYLFDLPIFDAIRRTPRTAMRDEYEITDSIQILIDDGYPVTVADVVVDDVNVSFPQDLLKCNLMQLRKQSLPHLISDTASLVSQARIEHSVVGRDASIAHPIRIANSVIFDGAHVTSSVDLDCAIVTADVLVDCRNQAAHLELWAQA